MTLDLKLQSAEGRRQGSGKRQGHETHLVVGHGRAHPAHGYSSRRNPPLGHLISGMSYRRAAAARHKPCVGSILDFEYGPWGRPAPIISILDFPVEGFADANDKPKNDQSACFLGDSPRDFFPPPGHGSPLRRMDPSTAAHGQLVPLRPRGKSSPSMVQQPFPKRSLMDWRIPSRSEISDRATFSRLAIRAVNVSRKRPLP